MGLIFGPTRPLPHPPAVGARERPGTSALAPSPAVEVGGLLAVELALHGAAVLRGPEPLEAVVDQLRVLLVEVLVRHDVGRAGVHLVAPHLTEGTQFNTV